MATLPKCSENDPSDQDEFWVALEVSIEAMAGNVAKKDQAKQCVDVYVHTEILTPDYR